MKKTPPPSQSGRKSGDWSAIDLIEQFTPEGKGPLEWWFRLTAPAEPPNTHSFVKRERARRGRLASTTLLFMSLVTVLPIPFALITSNHLLLVALLITLLCNAISLLLNRLGKLVAAGILFVVVLDASFILSLLTTPGGLDVGDLPTFDLLSEALLIAVAFFPARSVLVVLAFNCLFIGIDLTFQQHTPALAHYLVVDSYHAIVRPIILQIIVAGVVYLWVRSANGAILRADRAEVIAKLEHGLAEKDQRIVEQKAKLDMSIDLVVQTLARYSNGDTAARVPLTQENVLWHIAGSINNLLSRLHHLRRGELELQKKIQYSLYHVHRVEQENAALRAALQERINTEGLPLQQKLSPPSGA